MEFYHQERIDGNTYGRDYLKVSERRQNMETKRIKTGFWGILGSFLVSAMTPVLIPFATDVNGNLTEAGYATGILFWLGLIIGIAGYVLLSLKTKEQIAKIAKRKLPTVLCFFSNGPAIAADVGLGVGVVITIICVRNIYVNKVIAILGLVLMLAGIYAHFLLNGKLYRYIWSSKKGQEQGTKTEERKE